MKMQLNQVHNQAIERQLQTKNIQKNNDLKEKEI